MPAKSRRHPCPTVDELKSLARRPVLHKDEAISLTEGFCPDRSSPKGCCSYLASNASQVEIIKAAEAHGDISFPIKTTSLVIWCNKNDITLPEIFVHEVTSQLIKVRRPTSAGPYTDELIRFSENDHNRDIIRRGRKRVKEVTVRGYEPNIINEARMFVRKHIQEHGDMPLKKIVNHHLSESTGRPESKMNRAFSLNALLTPTEIKIARRKFRRLRQQSVKDDQ